VASEIGKGRESERKEKENRVDESRTRGGTEKNPSKFIHEGWMEESRTAY